MSFLDKKKVKINIKESSNSLVLSFSYNEAIIKEIRTIPSRTYNSQKKYWIIPSNKQNVNIIKKKLEPLANLLWNLQENNSNHNLPNNFTTIP